MVYPSATQAGLYDITKNISAFIPELQEIAGQNIPITYDQGYSNLREMKLLVDRRSNVFSFINLFPNEIYSVSHLKFVFWKAGNLKDWGRYDLFE